MEDQKRFVTAMLLSGIIMLVYYVFYLGPQQERLKAEQQATAAQVQQQQTTVAATPEFVAPKGVDITIETDSVSGSFSTIGSNFNNLRLKKYNATLEEDSGNVILLSPKNSGYSASIMDNWTSSIGDTGEYAEWSLVSGSRLTPDTPVTLSYDGGDYKVQRVVSIDQDYLITLDDTVSNVTDQPISVVRRGSSRQFGLPDDLTNFFILQEGPVGVVDNRLVDAKYKKLTKETITEKGESGWVGLTDKYWLSAAIAPQGQAMTATYAMNNRDNHDVYQAGYELAPMQLSPGATVNSKGYIFAGPKTRDLLNKYTDEQGIAQMERAIDWGTLRILTRPFSWALTKLGNLTGNFGVGILLLTLIIKMFLFPLNNKAYASMAKMKAMQPKLEKMKTRYGDDRMKLQQEMMAMYRKEGVSPVAGCLPMIPQIFIFFALYKSLFITLEMRHAPFVGWIKDLSAKDPLSVLNLFGLLPWDAVPIGILSFFAIGPLALMYGGTMALTQVLNTPPADKMQARIFQLMPLIFMFILAPFAAGLLVYWVWNNILTFLQQYIITRKFGVETPLDRFFNKITGRTPKTAGADVEIIPPEKPKKKK